MNEITVKNWDQVEMDGKFQRLSMLLDWDCMFLNSLANSLSLPNLSSEIVVPSTHFDKKKKSH